MIKAIIFDMDGVLIDAREWHYEALNRALDLFGMSISLEDHLERFDGLPTKKKLEMLTEERKLPEELHKFLNDLKQDFTTDLILQKCRPVFKQQFALSKLKQKNYRLAVASNSIRTTVELMMDKSHLSQYLDLIVSASDVTTPKPDPEIYIEATRKLKLKPNECLVIEDSQFGLAAAIAADCHVMQVQSPDEVFLDKIMQTISQLDEKQND